MNDQGMPMLFPYDPAQYWEQVRKIIREEIAAINHLRDAPANSYETPGLTYKPLYSMDEIALMFGVSKPTLYDWTKHGKLKPVKIRRRVYYLHTDIQQLLRSDAGR
jgi:excisionase family DNA binding protein